MDGVLGSKSATDAMLEAAELGGAAQGVGHAAGGAEAVDQEQDAAAVDAEHGRAGLVADRDGRVPQGALPHGDLAAAVALHLVTRAEPAAEHADDLTGRDVLARHPDLRHGPRVMPFAEGILNTGGVTRTATRRCRAAGCRR